MFRALFDGRREAGLKAGLRVERLDDRLVPTTFSFDADTRTAFVDGDLFGSDAITVRHHGNGSVTVSDKLGNGRRFVDVDRFVVNTWFGDDVVSYQLDGTLTRNMDIVVRLDGPPDIRPDRFVPGRDRFTGTLDADIAAFNRLGVSVHGGAGTDLITMYGTPTAPVRAGDFVTDGLAINEGGLHIGFGAELDLDLDGGEGNDRIFVDYRGELDGLLTFDTDGGGGDDTVSVVARTTVGSAGQVGKNGDPSAVRGGFGSDDLMLHVFGENGNNRPVFAQIDGGEDADGGETDRGSRTGNVQNAGGLEEDHMILIF